MLAIRLCRWSGIGDKFKQPAERLYHVVIDVVPCYIANNVWMMGKQGLDYKFKYPKSTSKKPRLPQYSLKCSQYFTAITF